MCCLFWSKCALESLTNLESQLTFSSIGKSFMLWNFEIKSSMIELYERKLLGLPMIIQKKKRKSFFFSKN